MPCFTHNYIIGTSTAQRTCTTLLRPGQPVPSSGHTASAWQPLPSSLPNSGSTGLSPVLTLAGGQTMAGSLVGLSTFMKSNSRGSHLLGERPMASGSPQLHEGQGRRPGHCPRRAQHRGRTCQQQLGHHTCAGELYSAQEMGCKLTGASDLIAAAEGIVTSIPQFSKVNHYPCS